MTSRQVSKARKISVVHIHYLPIEMHLPLGDARDIQQVIDQPRLQFHVVADHGQNWAGSHRPSEDYPASSETARRTGVSGVRSS